jgi:mycothiol synthase
MTFSQEELNVLTKERTVQQIERTRIKPGRWPTSTVIPVPDAPAIPGLTFRGFRGREDYRAMVTVLEGSKEADGMERVDSVGDVARAYRHLVNCDPYQDMLFVQIREQVIGYGRVWWQRERAGHWLYQHFAHLLPAWRELGIRRAMLRHNERRLRQIAASQRTDDSGALEACAADTEVHWESLLTSEGYEAVRHHYDMVRADLKDVPDLPLPRGLQGRPVRPGHLLRIRDAAQEAFRDQWGETESEGAWFEEWQEAPTFNPELWQVAWDGDEVAGMVLNFVDQAENREYGRRRGYTEGISVRRPWRRRGLARALLARSLRLLNDQGMEEAALGVDAENPNGALRLYESMGFQTVKCHTTYRKPLDLRAASALIEG